jgi:hypothetical protein
MPRPVTSTVERRDEEGLWRNPLQVLPDLAAVRGAALRRGKFLGDRAGNRRAGMHQPLVPAVDSGGWRQLSLAHGKSDGEETLRLFVAWRAIVFITVGSSTGVAWLDDAQPDTPADGFRPPLN